MKRWDSLALLAGGCSLGVACGIFFPASAFDAMVIVGLAFIAGGFSFFGKPFFVRGMFLCGALLFGIWHGGEEWKRWESLPAPSEATHGEGIVIGASTEQLFFQESEIRLGRCEETFCPREKILLREPTGTKRRIGNRVGVVCDLKRPDEYIDISGRRVAYRLILASRGIGYLCEHPTSVEARGEEGNGLIVFSRSLASLQEYFVASFERSLPATEAALSLGMLIGADDGFSTAEKTLFIRTGVTHVTAVSGYNITLVGGLLFFCAIVFGCYRRGASIIAVIGISLYVLLVGAPASAVRAGIMGALLFCSLAIGRPGSGFRVWGLALTAMLFVDPLLLRYDIGFQLSYLATFALLLYAGVRDRFRMPRNVIGRALYEGMLLSLFVEWLVTPLIIVQFGTFSGVSIVANIFLVLLVPFIMGAAFLSGIVACVVSGGIFFLNGITYFFAHAFIVGAEALERMPGSFYSGLSVPWSFIVSWYVVSGFLFWFFWWRKRDMMEEEYIESV